MKHSRFYTFFPPPEFLRMNVVGLDISDASLRFVELKDGKYGFEVGRFGYRPIPQGIIDSGEVKKPQDLKNILLEVKKTHGIEFVAVSLPEEKAFLFELVLPQMKYSEIRGAIELSLEDNIPLSSPEVLFDYDILEETDSTLRVAVSAVPRSLVDGYLEACAGTGVVPVAFEIEAQSIARAVVPQNLKEVAMVIDFGKTRTGISIVDQGVVKFSSTIALGGDAVTASIAKTLDVTLEQAERIKHNKETPSQEEAEKVSSAVMFSISVLRDEVNKHYLYWQNRTNEGGVKRPAIQKIYLCGGDSNLKGFLEYMAQGLAVPVALSNVLVNVNVLDRYVPKISFGDSLGYATAIGLALRSSQ